MKRGKKANIATPVTPWLFFRGELDPLKQTNEKCQHEGYQNLFLSADEIGRHNGRYATVVKRWSEFCNPLFVRAFFGSLTLAAGRPAWSTETVEKRLRNVERLESALKDCSLLATYGESRPLIEHSEVTITQAVVALLGHLEILRKMETNRLEMKFSKDDYNKHLAFLAWVGRQFKVSKNQLARDVRDSAFVYRRTLPSRESIKLAMGRAFSKYAMDIDTVRGT